ncbi:hypothetical protein AX15_003535 [Amanita polypyramis BW_CC]|nr:hypothetical protein AX15_003535 [Amanita polypyramis BW_CC]
MPLIYNTVPATTRAHHSSVAPVQQQQQPTTTQQQEEEVDDDIVLSDLVRGTGEASRLRRRGALRVERNDHHSSGSATQIPTGALGGVGSTGSHYTAVSPPGRRRPSRWEVFVPYEDGEEGQPQVQPQTQPQPQPQPQPQLALPFPVAPPLDLDRDEQDEYRYVLRCGGQDLTSSHTNPLHDAGYDSDSDHLHHPSPCSSAFVPSILPLYPPRPKSSLNRPSSSPKPRRLSGSDPHISTNGCGAIIHTKAAPRPKLGMWTAKTKASDSVVHLDSCYFESLAVGRTVRSSCGCVREGVGCAMCGNPLGSLYTPCKSAMEGLFSSPAPTATRQPQPQPQGQTSPSKLHIYSLFSTAVSSYPPYKFPSSSPSASASSSSRYLSNSNSNNPPWPTRYRISLTNPNPNSTQSYPYPNSNQTQSSYPYTSNSYVYPYAYPYPYPYSYSGSASGSETSLISGSSDNNNNNNNEDEEAGDEDTDHEEGVVVHGYSVPVGLVGGVRAPRLRRTYSGFSPTFDTGTGIAGLEEGGSGGGETFFFGRYFSSSPVPLEEEDEEGLGNEDVSTGSPPPQDALREEREEIPSPEARDAARVPAHSQQSQLRPRLATEDEEER